jgi:hypothetical protein
MRQTYVLLDYNMKLDIEGTGFEDVDQTELA